MINKLNTKDINQSFVDNIAFVFISNPGSLGPDGEVRFVLTDCKEYSCNIAYKECDNYIDYDLLKKKLSSFNFELDLTARIRDFDSVYLGGCGNHLAVKTKYALEFYRFTCGDRPVEIFEN